MSDLQQIQNPAPEPLPEMSFRQQLQERFDFAWTYILVVLIGLIVIFTIWHGTKFFDRTNRVVGKLDFRRRLIDKFEKPQTKVWEFR